MVTRLEPDARLARLQVLAVVLPLAYIGVLFGVLHAADLSSGVAAVLAIVVSLPLVALFAYLVFRVINGMREETLRRERRFRELLESAPDAIVIVDKDGRIIMANEQSERVFGFTTNELIGESVERLIPPGLHERHAANRRSYYANATRRPMGRDLELVAQRKDGTVFPVEISLSPIEAEEGLLVTSVIRDITDRRRNEEERERLKAEAEAERERQRIGMDLHDGVIQSIYAVGLNLEMAADDVKDAPDEVEARIEQAIHQLNDTIRDIRSYIFDLRPTRYSGDLRESLAHLADEFRVNSLADVTIEIAEELPTLEPDRALALFHIAQEALNNVRKHARATAVTLLLESLDGDVILQISDNGVGFDPASHFSEEHRGLRNMRSRAEAAGGILSMDSKQGAGTTTTIRIPQPATAGGQP